MRFMLVYLQRKKKVKICDEANLANKYILSCSNRLMKEVNNTEKTLRKT